MKHEGLTVEEFFRYAELGEKVGIHPKVAQDLRQQIEVEAKEDINLDDVRDRVRAALDTQNDAILDAI